MLRKKKKAVANFLGYWLVYIKNLGRVGAVVSIVFINRVTNECFGRRCSRSDDTFKGNRAPVKAIFY